MTQSPGINFLVYQNLSLVRESNDKELEEKQMVKRLKVKFSVLFSYVIIKGLRRGYFPV